MRDRDGTLRVGSQRQAGDAQHRGLLLHPSGVGDHRLGPTDKAHEVQIAEWLHDVDAGMVIEAERLEDSASAGMQRQDDVSARGSRMQESHEFARCLGVINIARAMEGGDDIGVRQLQSCLHALRIESIEVGKQGVDHRIADEVNAFGIDTLAGEMRDRVRAGAEQEVGEAIGDDAIDLLRHGHIEGPQSRLDMRDRDAQLARRDRGRQCGIDIAVDDHHLRACGEHLLFEPHKNGGGLLGMGARANAEVDVWAREIELAKEDLRHPVVVVLAGVDKPLAHPHAGQGGNDRSGLGEVRASPRDVEQGHRGLPVAGDAASPASSIPDREVEMRTLGYARRVPLAISGAVRRFTQDPARGRAALERAVPRLRRSPKRPDGAAALDRAIARDRYEQALAALASIPRDAPERAGCELAFAVLAGRLTEVASAEPRDSRGRRAVRSARRQLAVMSRRVSDIPPAAAPATRPRGGPPRILHVVTNSLPVTQAGSTIRTHRIAGAQRDLGWDARVVTRPGYPVTHGDLRADDPQVLDGVSYHRLLPLVMPPEESLAPVYAGLLGNLVDRLLPDVLHAASDQVNAAAAREVGRSRGIPVAYEARSFFEDTWLARHGGEDAREVDTFRLLQQRHTDVLLAADVVTTLGTGMRDAIIARGVDPARVFITPNAVPMDFLDVRDVRASRERLGVPSALWIGSVATINDDEGMDTLVEAIALLREAGIDARGLIVGDGPGLVAVRALAHDLHVPLISPGRVPVEEVKTWFDALDVFGLPRRDSSVYRLVTPLKPLEAQARGIPTVGSDLPAITEVLAPGSALVRPDDPRALAEALLPLADPALRAEQGERARRWIAETRTWPSVMEAYRSAYALVGVPV